jgi:hypothetical protein
MDHIDIVRIISSYLKPVDNYHLSLTAKFYQQHIDVRQSIIKEINDRLYKIFG